MFQATYPKELRRGSQAGLAQSRKPCLAVCRQSVVRNHVCERGEGHEGEEKTDYDARAERKERVGYSLARSILPNDRHVADDVRMKSAGRCRGAVG